MLLVEGFLKSLDSKNGEMRKLRLEVSSQGISENPLETSELVQGVLHRLPERDNGKSLYYQKNSCLSED